MVKAIRILKFAKGQNISELYYGETVSFETCIFDVLMSRCIFVVPFNSVRI